jgi:hypothetical protein
MGVSDSGMDPLGKINVTALLGTSVSVFTFL